MRPHGAHQSAKASKAAGVRPDAAHGLRIGTRGERHKMRFRPDVDACRMQGDGGQVWWESGSESCAAFLLA